MKRTSVQLIASAALTISLFAAPAMTFADTTQSAASATEIQSIKDQIKSLLDQVTQLTNRLNGLTNGTIAPSSGTGTGSTTPTLGKCPMPVRNLTIGAQGPDVKAVQQFLAQDPSLFSSSNVTGYFGPVTAQAMKQFQVRNNIAVSTDGSVGPLTRSFFQRCGDTGGGGTLNPGDVKPVDPNGYYLNGSTTQGSTVPNSPAPSGFVVQPVTGQPVTPDTSGSTGGTGTGSGGTLQRGQPTPNVTPVSTTNSMTVTGR